MSVNGLRLIAAAHTPSLRRAVFGGDDAPDDGGRNAALALHLPHHATWVSAPSRAAVTTAQLISGTTPHIDPRLSDPDYGTWTGHTLDQVDLGDWLTDPHTAPHGGESLAAVTARAGDWLDHHTGRTLTAVTHPTVVRALLTHALGLPPDGIWRFDVAPLSTTRLTHRAGRWHLTIT